MIQIRKKGVQQRQELRRQYLDNYFKLKRRTCFSSAPNNPNNTKNELQQYESLLTQSLQQNFIANAIKDPDFLILLQNLVTQTLQTPHLLKTKFLLTTISNALHDDQLQVNDKVALYRFSAPLFQTLNLSLDLSNKIHQQHFKATLDILHFQILTFYAFTANQTSQYLDEQDQIRIETQIYPAFLNILKYAFQHPQKLCDIKQFQLDIAKFFQNIFNPNQEFYDMGNRMKAQRLMPFFQGIFDLHLWLLKNLDHFAQHFIYAELSFFKSYVKLIDVFQDLPNFLNQKQIFEVMKFTLQKCSMKKQQTKLNFIFQILHTFVTKKLFIDEVQIALTTKDFKTGISLFEKAINLVFVNSEIKFRALEMVQVIASCRFNESFFIELIDQVETSIVDMCVEVLSRFENFSFGQSGEKNQIAIVLEIMLILTEKENSEGKKQGKVSLARRFESLGGKKAIENISQWMYEMETGDDMEIDYAINLIESIIRLIQIDIEIETVCFQN